MKKVEDALKDAVNVKRNKSKVYLKIRRAMNVI